MAFFESALLIEGSGVVEKGEVFPGQLIRMPFGVKILIVLFFLWGVFLCKALKGTHEID